MKALGLATSFIKCIAGLRRAVDIIVVNARDRSKAPVGIAARGGSFVIARSAELLICALATEIYLLWGADCLKKTFLTSAAGGRANRDLKIGLMLLNAELVISRKTTYRQ